MPWIGQLQSLRWSEALTVALGAYSLGCFCTGYYLLRWRTGQDVRQLGSGSVGARNIGRILGRSGFLLTLLGDLAKGSLAVWVALHFAREDWLVALAMLAAVAGHIWPAQLRFRGGKGIATSLGALLVYDHHLAAAYAILFLAGFLMLRRTVLPGLFAFLCLPLVSTFLGQPPLKAVEISVLAGLVLIAHRRNLVQELSHLVEHRQAHADQPPPKL
jgi:glycerol-3-phosphate acyltransferase PlsY